MRGKNDQPMAVFNLFTAPEHTRLTKALSLDNDGYLVKTAPQNAGSEWIETVLRWYEWRRTVALLSESVRRWEPLNRRDDPLGCRV